VQSVHWHGNGWKANIFVVVCKDSPEAGRCYNTLLKHHSLPQRTPVMVVLAGMAVTGVSHIPFASLLQGTLVSASNAWMCLHATSMLPLIEWSFNTFSPGERGFEVMLKN
jgi:hypothetical protein